MVTAFGNQVGEFENFFGMSAEQAFQFVQVVVVHCDNEIVKATVSLTDFAAGEAGMVDTVLCQNFACTPMHVFAVVPAGSTRAVGADAIGNACLQGLVAEYVFGHWRAADVAEADEEYFVVFHGSLENKGLCPSNFSACA